MFIEINGHVNEHGEIEFETPPNLPPGDIRIIIESIEDAKAIAADEALWDEQFAKSQDFLDRLADQAHAEYVAGLTEEFDADVVGL